VVFSQRVLLSLVDKGLPREDAYTIVQSLAHQAWNTADGDFRALVSGSDRVQAHLTADEIDACFDPNHHLRNLDEVYQRLGI
ncbi:MAG: adenylosuccinate lyase, partial [Cyanobacteria bacterium P01_H01_bin.153]